MLIIGSLRFRKKTERKKLKTLVTSLIDPPKHLPYIVVRERVMASVTAHYKLWHTLLGHPIVQGIVVGRTFLAVLSGVSKVVPSLH